MMSFVLFLAKTLTKHVIKLLGHVDLKTKTNLFCRNIWLLEFPRIFIPNSALEYVGTCPIKLKSIALFHYLLLEELKLRFYPLVIF